MAAILTPSEQLVSVLSSKSFLSLWTHPSPVGKKGKQLCDCLVICGPHIIIISVKECTYKDTGDTTGWKRWQAAAIEESASQIWGAERWLCSADRVIRHDGREVTLPRKEVRQFHRLMVSLGGRGQVPLEWGDFGHGFVHLLDEYSLQASFSELDTVTDFVRYLTASESILTRGVRPMFSGSGIEDLLAMYVLYGPDFGLFHPVTGEPALAVIEEGIWNEVSQSKEYRARKESLKVSYKWDNLIEHFVSELLTDGIFDMHSKEVTKNELALVAMALQPRGHRANLAESFLEFLHLQNEKVAARVIIADNQTAFCFLCRDSSIKKSRAHELLLRCLVVRGRCEGVKTVIGIATDRPREGHKSHSFDIAYLHMLELSNEEQIRIDEIIKSLGYFENAKWAVRHQPSP